MPDLPLQSGHLGAQGRQFAIPCTGVGVALGRQREFLNKVSRAQVIGDAGHDCRFVLGRPYPLPLAAPVETRPVAVPGATFAIAQQASQQVAGAANAGVVTAGLFELQYEPLGLVVGD